MSPASTCACASSVSRCHLDVVLAGDETAVFINDGHGHFTARPLGSELRSWAVAVADLDGDGTDDILITGMNIGQPMNEATPFMNGAP
jgi:VCBS repeat protein